MAACLGLALVTARCGGHNDSRSAVSGERVCPAAADTCYFLLEDGMRGRDEANTACAATANGGHLATFSSKAIQTDVMSAEGLNPKGDVRDYWFGIDCPARNASCNSTAEGVWKWITGKALDYNDWSSTPNDGSGCAGLRRVSADFRWDDHGCANRFFGVCESPKS